MDGSQTLDGERRIEHTLEQGHRFVRRMYVPRILGTALAAICIGGGLWERSASSWVWAVLFVHCAFWPHIAYRLARRSRDPYRAELRNLMFDSAAGGAAIAGMGFNIVPSAVVVAVLLMDKAAIGGMRFLARCFIVQVVATALVSLAAGFPLNVASGPIAQLTTLPLLLLFPATVGYTAYRLARRVRQQNDLLSTLSSIDGLTHLLNRTHWEQAVATEFQRCRRIGHPSAVMMLDIDHFKEVNDIHGHQAGDAALTAVAAILQDTLRLSDTAGRYGGEEFGVVLPGINSDGAFAIAERIRRRIEQAVVEQRRGLQVTVSIGYAALSPDDHDHGAWIARADRALYAAKAAGRNCCIGSDAEREAA